MRALAKVFTLAFVLAFAAAGGAASAAESDGPMSVRTQAVPAGSMSRPEPALVAPVPSAGEDRAQLMGSVCRWGYYYCWLRFPMPVGSACYCDMGFWGTVSMQ